MYKYDAWGNIAMKWVYSGYSTATPSSSNLIKKYDYVYSSSTEGMDWDDLLTEYDGEAIVYDNIGNPTTYRGKTMAWEGRNLIGLYDSDTAALYGYDASGIRTMKYHDGEMYYYYYVEGKLMCESCSLYDLFYTYDSRGNLSGIKKVAADGTATNYGVLSNMFGDVLGIFDLSGNLLAKYTYDSWGKLLSITNASDADISSTDGIWLQNSIRYRGYVYDNESGWYYLQSRYYDPEICRFINADVLLANINDFTGYNLYAYCGCNPLVNEDANGKYYDSLKNALSFILAAGTANGCFVTVDEYEKTPSWSPIIITYGTSNIIQNGKTDNSWGGIYTEYRLDAPIYSTLHADINLGNSTIGFCFGFDNIGIEISHKNEQIEISKALILNPAELKVGIERNAIVQWDDGNKRSSFVNVSIDGLFIASVFVFSQTGQWVPSTTPTPVPAPVPA